jgi:hypothetical protein
MICRVLAPFPIGHPVNRLNPYIEPWWNTLRPVGTVLIYPYIHRTLVEHTTPGRHSFH